MTVVTYFQGYQCFRVANIKAIAIRAANSGYAQLSSEIAPRIFSQIESRDCDRLRYLDTLSPRELEVLLLIGHGKNNGEISSTCI